MADATLAVKVLRYLKKHVEIRTDGGWSLERDRRKLDKDNLTITFRYVVDHHQAEGIGTIQEQSFEVVPVTKYIKQFSNPPEHWQRGDKLGIQIDNAERLCSHDELLLVDDHRYPVGLISDEMAVTMKAVERCLEYDGD